ncbi:MAG: ATP-binding protein [Vicinamibacterales bacterium]
MKRWFESLPVHRKLIALALGVSSAAVLTAVIGLAVFDIARYRDSADEDARALAQLIAENITAAIVFDDPDAAAATLATVRVRPIVARACAYDADGYLLAGFVRPGGSACPDRPVSGRSWSFVSETVVVRSNGQDVGRVFVERALSDLRGRVTATAAAGLTVILLAGVIAFAVAQSLQRLVSTPIIALAQAARRIGREHAYHVPEIAAPPDETGELVHAFSDMVQRVGESNAALVASNEALRVEVAERRRMQDERELLLAREREASRLKDEFLATVSHELRTPLNAILGWTQILSSTPPAPQTLEKAIASLSRNAQAQHRVIQDLLDISRIITGKLQLTLDAVDLRSVVESAIEVIEPIASSKGIALDARLPGIACVVQGDYDRLRQVLWNLLSNAVKFTPAGGHVLLRLTEAGDGYAVSVADDGIGIPPAFLPHVFERFRQVDGSITRQQGGLGLGLAIVKELTELHGGSASVESLGTDRGAVFTVTLPRLARSPRQRDEEAIVDLGPLPRLDGSSVLVVDDNVDALDVISQALAGAGAAVRSAASGAEAVAEWTRQPADVLLCDLAMPGMDGFEVLHRITEIDGRAGRASPAIAVTAYASDEYRNRCLRAGFIGHLAKPIRMSDAIRAVAAVLAPR